MLEEAAQLALDKAGMQGGQVQFYIGGDLMNQIVSNTFAARTLAMLYLGILEPARLPWKDSLWRLN